MLNAFTVDLEDWFCVRNMRHALPPSMWDDCELRITRNTRRLLRLLREHRVEATFFVLGWIARKAPDLILEIEDDGHEIATHGHFHDSLDGITREAFEVELEHTLRTLGDLVHAPILGFRAPSFTIGGRTLWALDVLKRWGLLYDSSIYPFGGHPEYGMPDAPLGIHRLENGLMEIPMSCVEIGRRRFPCSGGGYFRWLPYPLFRRMARSCNAAGRPLIFYIHPWEIDTDQPVIPLPTMKRIRHYRNLDKTFSRLEMLLDEFSFTSMRNLVTEYQKGRRPPEPRHMQAATADLFYTPASSNLLLS